MKIIFLDYDGVLVSSAEMRRWKETEVPHSVDSSIIVYLNMIIEKTSTEENPTQCVVVSTWRKHGYRHCRQPLADAGFKGSFHEDWTTKVFENRAKRITRGHEVNEWLSRHPEVTDYVIIDDEGIGSYNRNHWLVQTDTYQGMIYEDALLAISILNKEKENSFVESMYAKWIPKRLSHNLNQIDKLKGVSDA